MAKLKVTPAAEFRKMREQGVEITLPSGRVVRMRTVTPDRLLKLGKIPDILTQLVIKMFYGQVTSGDFNGFLDAREELEQTFAQFESLRVVCTAGLLEPRIVDNPQADDEIAIDDLTMSERGWIFRLAFVEADDLATFRQRQTPNVEVVPDGDQDSEPTQ